MATIIHGYTKIWKLHRARSGPLRGLLKIVYQKSCQKAKRKYNYAHDPP